MTAQEYRDAGFAVSSLIDQAFINRAENDIKQAYLQPILSVVNTDEAAVKDALMNLSFLLLLRRNTFATRSGAKEKQTPQSYTPETAKVLQEQANICDTKLNYLRNLDGANKDAKVEDICGIYFTTNYFFK